VVIVDCSLPAIEVEHEVLGYREESTERFIKGALERANGGTVIFANFDGLEEMFQRRLHQVLNELNDYAIDVRIIATTTKNLSKLVGAGKFYRGLYLLVSGAQISLSPLRERSADIAVLTKAFLKEVANGRDDMILSEDAMDKIMNHYWAQNISELKLALEEAVKNNQNGILTASDLAIGEEKTKCVDEEGGFPLMSLHEAEMLLIKKSLIHTGENRTQAARILGVSIRTLRNKINEYRGANNEYFVNLR
jgi:two-component system response regulator FlrC